MRILGYVLATVRLFCEIPIFYYIFNICDYIYRQFATIEFIDLEPLVDSEIISIFSVSNSIDSIYLMEKLSTP